jgi:hypothetical protein
MNQQAQERYPQIGYLLGCYLHQDYSHYGGSLGAAVQAFVRDEQPDIVAALHAEIARFLSECRGREDAELDAIDSARAHPPGLSAADYLHFIDSALGGAVRPRAAE